MTERQIKSIKMVPQLISFNDILHEIVGTLGKKRKACTDGKCNAVRP